MRRRGSTRVDNLINIETQAAITSCVSPAAPGEGMRTHQNMKIHMPYTASPKDALFSVLLASGSSRVSCSGRCHQLPKTIM